MWLLCFQCIYMNNLFLFMSSLCTIKIPTKQSQFSSTIFVTVFKTISWQLLGFLHVASYHSWLSLDVKCRWLRHVQLCDSMDWSPPGSSVRGILRPEYWSGYPFPSPGDLNQRSNPGLPHCRQIIYHLSHEYALVILIYCWSDHNTRSTLAFIYKRYMWNFCVYLHSHKITKNGVALEMQKTISVLLHDFMCNRNLLFISCLNDF